MANTAQARKRARQSENRRQQNSSQRSALRTVIKNVRKAIETKNVDTAQKAYQVALPVIDRMADKGLIHKNSAARQKSRLNIHLKKMTGHKVAA